MHASNFRAAAALAICSLLIGASAAVHGADGDAVKAAKEQVRRLQEQKRVLDAEKAQWQQERETLSAKLAAAEEEAARKKVLEARVQDLQRRLRSADEAAGKMQAEIGELKNQGNVREAELAKLNGQLDNERQGRSRAETQVAACSEKNDALYRQGRGLLEAFGRGGRCDAVSGEPLLGLGAIARENRFESERDSLDAGRYRPAAQP